MHAEPQQWGKKMGGGSDRSQSDRSGFIPLFQESWFRENEWKQTEGQGKIKIQKYIFMFIFIYIYIFTRYVSTKKRKHPKFQNRQSVFPNVSLLCDALKETLILIKKFKIKKGNLCCPTALFLCQTSLVQFSETRVSSIRSPKTLWGAAVRLLHSKKNKQTNKK